MIPIVSARGLVKRFGDEPVVQGIDLEIRAGECFGLLGPNGAGKTTTLRMLLGLTLPSGGDLHVFGLPVPAAASRVRERCGVVPQQDNLDPDFTVEENLRVYARYFGIDRRATESRLPQLLEFASLTNKRAAGINTLSGGMKRRLTLARALVNDPDLVFLDEPTTGLDPQARHLIWQRLRSLRQAGKTLILTTHYMEEAQRLCDRIAILDHGRLLDLGSPAELIARHIEPEVVEIGDAGRYAWLAEAARAHATRVETIGESLFCYGTDLRVLIAQLREQGVADYHHRPASLEDVFLKLTGRDLRE